MPGRCVVIGCTSGYDSNKEKKTMFSVPKNPELLKQWQEAAKLKRNLNESTVFCENHFFANDIISSKKIKDKDGNIVQEVC